MKFAAPLRVLPSLKNALLAILAAGLLILAFPDFEYWFLAWFALVPLMWAVERESRSTIKSFVLGWIFGTVFFFGTCWWLTYAPITYAGFPRPLAYLLLLGVTAVSGLFPAVFAGVLALLLRRFGSWAFLAAPFVWVAAEFMRYWVTGNNWNAVGYSQALGGWALDAASLGGVLLVSYAVLVLQSVFLACLLLHGEYLLTSSDYSRTYRTLYDWATHKLPIRPVVPLDDAHADGGPPRSATVVLVGIFSLALVLPVAWFVIKSNLWGGPQITAPSISAIIAVQPNVPMSGLDIQKWRELRERQIGLAETEIRKINNQRTTNDEQPTLVILPESPMNFMYEDDREFQTFINDFARRNQVSVLFNSAEPDATNGKYFNSAVMVSREGREAAQYDKIYLLPFGEAVPSFLEDLVPGFVGNFSYGREYDLLPVGGAKAGVMICFESHFGQLSREYVRNGADVIIEMTNDGYLGPTPVLRQHLANAVFRAVETNRPVLRATNVGITAYIDESGNIIDPAPSYSEATRVWTVSKSDGKQTLYVRYGDWFAWLCSVVTVGLLIICFWRREAETRE